MFKAMILAAGQGKRLRPITNTIPKPMVSVGGQTLIGWHLQKLKALGVDNIVVNGAYLKEVLFDYLKDGSAFGVNIIPSPEEGDGLETAGGIINALPLLGSEPFLVINGDIFLDSNYDFLKTCPDKLLTYDDKGEPNLYGHLFLTNNPAHNQKGDYAISEEGLLSYGSDYTFSGFAWYHPQAFTSCAVAREPLRPYFDKWVAQGKLTASVLSAKWFDVGTVDRLNELNTYLANHKN